MKPILAATAITALLTPAASHAALFATPVQNADFEAQKLGPPNFNAAVTDWAEGDAPGFATGFIQWEDSNAAVPQDAGVGENWGGFQFRDDGPGDPDTDDGPGELYQQIGTVTANESYDVSLNVGYRSDRGFGNLVVTLFTTNSGTGIADADTLDGTRSASIAGYLELDQFIYTTTPDTVDGDAIGFQLDSGALGTDGNPLWIALSMNAGSNGAAPFQPYVDDIEIGVVPEPASLALLGLGGLCLLTGRRHG